MLHNGVLVSALQQSESAICIHISPYLLPLASPSHLPIPPLYVVTQHQADLPVLCGCFPLAIYFTFGSVYLSMPVSHFVPACPSPLPVSSSPFSMSVFIPVLPLGSSEQFFFFSVHIHVSIQYLFFSF